MFYLSVEWKNSIYCETAMIGKVMVYCVREKTWREYKEADIRTDFNAMCKNDDRETSLNFRLIVWFNI